MIKPGPDRCGMYLIRKVVYGETKNCDNIKPITMAIRNEANGCFLCRNIKNIPIDHNNINPIRIKLINILFSVPSK
jgi:hypothetical protein